MLCARHREIGLNTYYLYDTALGQGLVASLSQETEAQRFINLPSSHLLRVIWSAESRGRSLNDGIFLSRGYGRLNWQQQLLIHVCGLSGEPPNISVKGWHQDRCPNSIVGESEGSVQSAQRKIQDPNPDFLMTMQCLARARTSVIDQRHKITHCALSIRDSGTPSP